MNISWSRLCVALLVVGTLAFDTAYFANGGKHWQLASASCLLGICIFLALVDFGVIRTRVKTMGFLLHLRCQRHPSIRAYCGYEHDFRKFCQDRRGYTEVIEFVALRHPSGRIYATEQPGRHSHVIALMHEYNDGDGRKSTSDQGFVTSHGRYVGRQEAWDIASLANQIQRITGSTGTLFSEDLFAGPLLSEWQLEEQAWQLVHAAHHCNRLVSIEHKPADHGQVDMIPSVRPQPALQRWLDEQAQKAQQAETSHG